LSGVTVGDPLFRDPAAGDFRLSAGSAAIDRCAPIVLGHDLAGVTRGVDDPDTADALGPYDIGAYEFVPAGSDPGDPGDPGDPLVFRNGFEP
jgi:hypothetical protein